MNTTWTVKIDRLPTQLRVGVDDDELAPQTVWVSLRLRGVYDAHPAVLADCIDYAPLCRWIAHEWPRSPHVGLLETRFAELAACVFDLDPRVQDVEIGLAKQRLSGQAFSVGIERFVTRLEFESHRRGQAFAAATRTAIERTCNERQPA